MGYLTLGILAITVYQLIMGALSGLMRGRNRAILRLGLVIASAFLAIALRGMVIKAVMGIEFEGQTLDQMLMGLLNNGEVALPESLQNLALVLVEIVIGLLTYFILFFILH